MTVVQAALVVLALGFAARVVSFLGLGLGAVLYFIGSIAFARLIMKSSPDEQVNELSDLSRICDWLGNLIAAVSLSVFVWGLWRSCAAQADLVGICFEFQRLWRSL